MEIIKRKIFLESVIDRNYESPNYGAITATSFYVNVFLTQSIDDMGMFTDIEFEANNNPSSETLNRSIRQTGTSISQYYDYGQVRLTGLTESRAEDVRFYNTTTPYKLNFDTHKETYLNYSGETINSVNRVTSLINPLTYVFDASENDVNIGTQNQKNGLLFMDFTGATNQTIMSYLGEGLNETNSSLSAITKEEYLFGVISKPEVKSDIFIERSIHTIFEKHLKLSEITNLGELQRYGNGFYRLTNQ